MAEGGRHAVRDPVRGAAHADRVLGSALTVEDHRPEAAQPLLALLVVQRVPALCGRGEVGALSCRQLVWLRSVHRRQSAPLDHRGRLGLRQRGEDRLAERRRMPDVDVADARASADRPRRASTASITTRLSPFLTARFAVSPGGLGQGGAGTAGRRGGRRRRARETAELEDPQAQRVPARLGIALHEPVALQRRQVPQGRCLAQPGGPRHLSLRQRAVAGERLQNRHRAIDGGDPRRPVAPRSFAV